MQQQAAEARRPRRGGPHAAPCFPRLCIPKRGRRGENEPWQLSAVEARLQASQGVMAPPLSAIVRSCVVLALAALVSARLQYRDTCPPAASEFCSPGNKVGAAREESCVRVSCDDSEESDALVLLHEVAAVKEWGNKQGQATGDKEKEREARSERAREREREGDEESEAIGKACERERGSRRRQRGKATAAYPRMLHWPPSGLRQPGPATPRDGRRPRAEGPLPCASRISPLPPLLCKQVAAMALYAALCVRLCADTHTHTHIHIHTHLEGKGEKRNDGRYFRCASSFIDCSFSLTCRGALLALAIPHLTPLPNLRCQQCTECHGTCRYCQNLSVRRPAAACPSPCPSPHAAHAACRLAIAAEHNVWDGRLHGVPAWPLPRRKVGLLLSAAVTAHRAAVSHPMPTPWPPHRYSRFSDGTGRCVEKGTLVVRSSRPLVGDPRC